jgi:hypothetical protein
MFRNKKTRIALIGAAVLAIVAGASIASAAVAASQPNGSDAPVYLGDSLSNALVPAGTTFDYTGDYFGFNDPSNVAAPYVCPVDASASVVFVAPKGQEHTMSSWLGIGGSLFTPSSSKNVSQFDTSLYSKAGNNYASVRSNGGDYSVGLACTINNGVKLASAGIWYTTIHVTAGTGAYTVDQPTVPGPTPTPTPTTPPNGSANLTLKATTAAAQDGVLSLTAPTNSTVLIGSPVVDPTTHLSTSTGKLGNLTVSDGRVLTHKGWNLTTSVTDFALETDATKTIPKTQLGFSPVLVSIPSGATGIVTAPSQVAGSASYVAPFASADGSPVVGNGNTVLDANLTFVAPASAPAGTYDSTLTLTLTSK